MKRYVNYLATNIKGFSYEKKNIDIFGFNSKINKIITKLKKFFPKNDKLELYHP